jgi:hypothetical protein
MQSDALQAPAGQQCRYAVGTLVSDRDEQPGVRPNYAWQYERRGNRGSQGDDEWSRRRLDSDCPAPHLCHQLHTLKHD